MVPPADYRGGCIHDKDALHLTTFLKLVAQPSRLLLKDNIVCVSRGVWLERVARTLWTTLRRYSVAKLLAHHMVSYSLLVAIF